MRMDVDKVFKNREMSKMDTVLTDERRVRLVGSLMDLSYCLYMDGADDESNGFDAAKAFEAYRDRIGKLIGKIIDESMTDAKVVGK